MNTLASPTHTIKSNANWWMEFEGETVLSRVINGLLCFSESNFCPLKTNQIFTLKRPRFCPPPQIHKLNWTGQIKKWTNLAIVSAFNLIWIAKNKTEINWWNGKKKWWGKAFYTRKNSNFECPFSCTILCQNVFYCLQLKLKQLF